MVCSAHQHIWGYIMESYWGTIAKKVNPLRFGLLLLIDCWYVLSHITGLDFSYMDVVCSKVLYGLLSAHQLIWRHIMKTYYGDILGNDCTKGETVAFWPPPPR